NVLPVRSSGIWFGGFGLLSGLLGGLFSAGGPPLVYHFYRQPMAMEALRATLVAALTTMSVMRIVVVLATGQFSLLALKMILLAAPAVLGTSWLLRRYPPRWRRETVLRIVCVLLLATGVSIAASALLGR
ncbi:MAG: TSUP family transporter, partial [Arenimonas sp.]|nr:TSUP family transporter [Arenimonas sp.]